MIVSPEIRRLPFNLEPAVVAQDFPHGYGRAMRYLHRRSQARDMTLTKLLGYSVEAMEAVVAEHNDGRGVNDLSPQRISLEWLVVASRWLANAHSLLSCGPDLFAGVDQFREQLKAAGGDDLGRDQAMARLAAFALEHENLVEAILEKE